MAATHIVAPGDCLYRIAHRHGFSHWREIYDHELNADLRRKRPDPGQLHPGDVVAIPTERRAFKIGAGQPNTIRLASTRVTLRLNVWDDVERSIGMPLRYEIRTDVPAETFAGDVGADGAIVEHVPIEASEAELLLFDAATDQVLHEVRLLIGRLAPADTVSGIQARLNALGVRCGPVDGIVGPITEGAIRTLQRVTGLSVDGEVGPVTRDKIVELFGG